MSVWPSKPNQICFRQPWFRIYIVCHGLAGQAGQGLVHQGYRVLEQHGTPVAGLLSKILLSCTNFRIKYLCDENRKTFSHLNFLPRAKFAYKQSKHFQLVYYLWKPELRLLFYIFFPLTKIYNLKVQEKCWVYIRAELVCLSLLSVLFHSIRSL